MHTNRLPLLFTLYLSLFTCKAHAQLTKDLSTLDAYIQKGMADWQIPGLAVVVVKDGKVVVQKGYGTKTMGKADPVDADTRFFIASNSKLFTGMALSLAQQEGKLNLNDPVAKYLPGYQLYDETSTKLVTLRDLLAHRIGTETFQGDLTFWNSTLTSAQIVDKMRLLKPSKVFRQDYGYCNSCYLTAGLALEKATGVSWAQTITSRFIEPIGMVRTQALSNNLAQMDNVARPYTTSYSGQLKEIPYDQWDNLAPAASVVSCVSDLAKWLQFQLDSGRVAGKQIVPFAVLQRTRDVNIINSSRKSVAFPTHFRGYGLGLSSADYNGRQIYWHTGGAGGMVSGVCFVPEERLGIAILTNNDNQAFFEALRYQLLDAYLGVNGGDRSQLFLKGSQAEMKTQLDSIATWRIAAAAGAKNTQNHSVLASLAGTYRNPVYGTINLAPMPKSKSQLQVRFEHHPNLIATLTPIGQGNYLLEYNNIGYGVFKTQLTPGQGQAKTFLLKVNDFVEMEPYLFVGE